MKEIYGQAAKAAVCSSIDGIGDDEQALAILSLAWEIDSADQRIQELSANLADKARRYAADRARGCFGSNGSYIASLARDLENEEKVFDMKREFLKVLIKQGRGRDAWLKFRDALETIVAEQAAAATKAVQS